MASLDQTARQQMLAMINADLGMILTPSNVTYGVPTLVDPTVDNLLDPTKRNSTVVISTPANAGVRLNAEISYNRLKLPGLFQLHGNELVDGGESTTHQLLPKILLATGMELVAADIQDLPIDPTERSFTLRATASSLVCFGEVEMFLVEDTGPTDPTEWEPGYFINADMTPEELWLSSYWSPELGEPRWMLSSSQSHWYKYQTSALALGLKLDGDREPVIPTTGSGGLQIYSVELDEYGDLSPYVSVGAMAGVLSGSLGDQYALNLQGSLPSVTEPSDWSVDFEYTEVPNFLADSTKFTADSGIVWDPAESAWFVTIDDERTEVNFQSLVSDGFGLPAGAAFKWKSTLLQMPTADDGSGSVSVNNTCGGVSLTTQGHTASSVEGTNWEFPAHVLTPGDVVFSISGLIGFPGDLMPLNGLRLRIDVAPLFSSAFEPINDSGSIPAPAGWNEAREDGRALGMYVDFYNWVNSIVSEGGLARDGQGNAFGDYQIELTATNKQTEEAHSVNIQASLNGSLESVTDRFRYGDVVVGDMPSSIVFGSPEMESTISRANTLVGENFVQLFAGKAYRYTGSMGIGGGTSDMLHQTGPSYFANSSDTAWYLLFAVQQKDGAASALGSSADDAVTVTLQELVNIGDEDHEILDHGDQATFQITRELGTINVELLSTGQTWGLSADESSYDSEDNYACFVLNDTILAAAFPTKLSPNGFLMGQYRVIARRKVDGVVHGKLTFRVQGWEGGGPTLDLNDNFPEWFEMGPAGEYANFWSPQSEGAVSVRDPDSGIAGGEIQTRAAGIFHQTPSYFMVRPTSFPHKSIVSGVTTFNIQIEFHPDWAAMETERLSSNIYLNVFGERLGNRFLIGQLHLVGTTYDSETGTYSYWQPEVGYDIYYTFDFDLDLSVEDPGLTVTMQIGTVADPVSEIEYGVYGYSSYGDLYIHPIRYVGEM